MFRNCNATSSVYFSEYQEEVDYRRQLKAEARERQGEEVKKSTPPNHTAAVNDEDIENVKISYFIP